MSRQYKYDKKTGQLIETTPEKDRIDAEQQERDAAEIRAALRPLRRSRTSAGYPYASETMGVDPELVGECREIDRKHGVPTDYTKDGRPIMESRSHFLRYMRAHGFYERNGNTSPRNR
jgi:hypothetical protein